MRRAYSQIDIKVFDDDTREFSGIATTPTPDSVSDIVEPKGAVYKLPIPLLWQHRQVEPIGEIYEAKVSGAGIMVRGRVLKATKSRILMDRLDEAWESLRIGLVRGLSIGFSSIDFEPIKDTGGLRFKKWNWHELSAVTIPANQDATITAIKSIDREILAASGQLDGVVYVEERHRRVCRKSGVVYLEK